MLADRCCRPNRTAGTAARCRCRCRGRRRRSPRRPRSPAAASDRRRRGTRARCRSTWIRSARLGNRLIAGVQNSARFERVDDALERRLAAAEQHHELDLVAVDALERRRQPGQLEEAEALRKREILLQQAVALERAQRHRQQRLVVAEADRLDRRRRQQLVPARRRPSTGSTSTPRPAARHSSYSLFATSSRPAR